MALVSNRLGDTLTQKARSNLGIRFGRFTADTLDRLCQALEVQPGDLLEWAPDTKRRRG